MTAELWTLIDRIGIVVGLIVALPVFHTWWQITLGEKRRRMKLLAEISRHPGERPGVLVLDLLPGRDIQNTVEGHLAATPALKGIDPDRKRSVRREQALQPKDMAALAQEIRRKVAELYSAGVDVIHLFVGGPDVAALLVGAELSNGPRVLLYHFEQGKYVCFGPLEPLR